MFRYEIFKHKACGKAGSVQSFQRLMGGGPRTFPGGLNKWQWKRMHQKKASQKEQRLLDQEKQIYQARIRSQMRADSSSSSSSSSTHPPLSPQDQIKALADRFIKDGAVDLWNQDDGPEAHSPSPSNNNILCRPTPITSLTSLSKSRCFSTSVSGSWMHFQCAHRCFASIINVRSYSRILKTPKKVHFIRNESSESEDDDSIDSDSDSDFKKSRWKSSSALGKYDRKTTKRVPLKFLEDETNLASSVEDIRKEVSLRSLKGSGVNVEEGEEESFLSSKRFDECDISPLTVKALTAADYVQMTRVQEAALTASLEGKDVMVKAKTGTGKSVAFLLPAIETVIKGSKNNRNMRIPPAYVLIICPTRELASQIAAEVTVLLKYHDGVGVQTLVGGTRFKVDQKRLESDPCQMIVATPGRLLDHIENKSGFSLRLMGLRMLILDEADHLLDLGFRKDIEKILDCLPRQRQSLLFSATIPKEVRRVSQVVLKRDHAYIDTVGLHGLETNAKVRQAYFVAPHVEHFQIVHHLLEKHILEVVDYKVVIFCNTSMMSSLMFSLFREMKLNVREMHSRKPQIARTRTSDEFKESKRLVLITSDVSARGIHYPNVTLVIQVGIPPDREQYIHRLGRTGREGKAGEGVLLLAPWEEYFLDEIKDLPLEKNHPPLIQTTVKIKMQELMTKIDTSLKEAAYHAWLGYYNSISYIGRDKTMLVGLANSFSESIGLQKPPSLFRRTALKMGLKDIPGIQIRK
ncbi:hypothetical protein Leryth_026185 [Lithospermum erythrorhizon]|nr:hypothetical protein Leryth_026185 [Lithospermum erythrorhizon]